MLLIWSLTVFLFYECNFCPPLTLDLQAMIVSFFISFLSLFPERAGSVLSDSLRTYGLYPARLLLSMGFSRQEYWTGLPFLSLEDLPDPGIEPVSLKSLALAGGFFTTNPPGMS